MKFDVTLQIDNVNDFRFVLQASFDEALIARVRAFSFHKAGTGTQILEAKVPYKDRSQNNHHNDYQSNNNKNTNTASNAPASALAKCTFSGKINHTTIDCRKKQSEFANHTDRPFVGSEFHKRMVKLIGMREMISNFSGRQVLKEKAGESSSSSSSSATPKKPYGKKDWKKEGTFLHTILPIKFHTATSANLFPITLLMGRS